MNFPKFRTLEKFCGRLILSAAFSFKKMNITRFAPTPSGFLHIGNQFSFAITALVAEREDAQILLRIDDLDNARFRQEYLENIFATLEILDLNWQIGPKNPQDFIDNFSQQKRLFLYQNYLEKLWQKELVFACKCSRKDLQDRKEGGCAKNCHKKKYPKETKNAAWRIKTDDRKLTVKTWPNGEIQTQIPKEMKDFVVRRKDGIPAYQLASLADDLHFGVNLIVRGADLWPSTLAQLFLAEILEEKEFLTAHFFHHTLIKNWRGEKLSKSAGV